MPKSLSNGALGWQAEVHGTMAKQYSPLQQSSATKPKPSPGDRNTRRKMDLERTLNAAPRPVKMQIGELISNLRQEQRTCERSKFLSWNQKRNSIQKPRETTTTAPSQDGLSSVGDGNELRRNEQIQSLSEFNTGRKSHEISTSTRKPRSIAASKTNSNTERKRIPFSLKIRTKLHSVHRCHHPPSLI
jgi:hypothetical protein